ncbi:hypothetical protein M569_06659, partial [Genlisea aurea]
DRAVEGSCIGKEIDFVAPSVGMEFDCYDDAYNYYNYYARESGFSVRVKNSWFKRSSKEKYGAVLCCSSQGFKRVKGVNHIRRETRTGCPAMMRIRAVVSSGRWRILEVTLQHNHVLGVKPSNKKKPISSGVSSEPATLKLYRAVVVNSSEDRLKGSSRIPDQLNLKKGETQAMYNFLCRMQLSNPNFSYLVDLTEDGRLRNVFWIDARSLASACYFSDVVFFDDACLTNGYEAPVVGFFGVNHHGRSVLLGCGLLSDGTVESYTWFFRSWLSCNPGRIPRTVVTEKCEILKIVVAEAFPSSKHRFCLSRIVRRIPEKLGGLSNYEAVRKKLLKTVYESSKPVEFEAAWGFMIHHMGVADNEWLRSLYEDRDLWAPVFQSDVCFVGISGVEASTATFFDDYLQKQTSTKEFIDKYELAAYKNHNEEVIADTESRNSSPDLKTESPFEAQLSEAYTREIFRRFQVEVEATPSCLCTKLRDDAFLVRESSEIRTYEVLFDSAAVEVSCVCCFFGFNFHGYLCRHALCVLSFNGVEEVPSKYILPRWNRDYKRLRIRDGIAAGTELTKRYGELYGSAVGVVEEGAVCLERYKMAVELLESSL